MFARKLVSLAFILALALPLVSRAEADYGSNRSPASTKHKKAKGKGTKKAKKSTKSKKAKSGGHAKGKAKKSHAPHHANDLDGSGPVNHTPPEMKDDLPAPSAESTTDH